MFQVALPTDPWEVFTMYNADMFGIVWTTWSVEEVGILTLLWIASMKIDDPSLFHVV